MADPIAIEYDNVRKAEPVACRVPDSRLVGPSKPLCPKYFVGKNVPREGHPVGIKRSLAFLALVVALLALAAAWRWTPLHDWLAPERLGTLLSDVSHPGMRAFVAVSAVALASLAMVPLTLLAVVAGIVFEGWEAFCYVLTGAVSSSALGFLGGKLLSRGAIERLAGSRLGRLSERLASRGIMAVAVLRLVPIAPFGVFNLVAGASHLSLWHFLLGTLLGLAPGIGAIAFFSSTFLGA